MNRALLFLGFIISFGSFSQITDTLSNIKQKEEVHVLVEKMPVFPGGEAQMMRYLVQNMNFPQEYKGSGVKMIVYLSFIVNEEGKVENVKVLKCMPTSILAFEDEALRLVLQMPRWEPGEQNGKKVKVSFTLPIKFTSIKDDFEPKNKTK